MDKKTFEIIDGYDKLINRLYFKLEKLGINIDTLEELYEEFDNYKDQVLEIGEYLDKEKHVGKWGYVNKDYKGLPMYTKVEVIYSFENGYNLCRTATDLIYYLPDEIIKFNKEVKFMTNKEFVEKFRDVEVAFTSICKSSLHFTNEDLNIEIVVPYNPRDTWECGEKVKVWMFDGYYFNPDEAIILMDGKVIEN